LQHNRQWSVRRGRNGKPIVRVKRWRAFGRSATGLGTPGKFGVIEEYHESDKLLCDFDTERIPGPPLQSLAHTLGLQILWQRWDRTQRGWHLVVKVKQKLTLTEVICCQTLLGSDRARERLNLARAISLRLHPSKFWEVRANILFRRKICTASN
jgi:hypothetical protein